jgi:hypothetical protein
MKQKQKQKALPVQAHYALALTTTARPRPPVMESHCLLAVGIGYCLLVLSIADSLKADCVFLLPGVSESRDVFLAEKVQ